MKTQTKKAKTRADLMSKAVDGAPVKGHGAPVQESNDPYFDHPEVRAAIKRGEDDIKAGRVFHLDPETKTFKPCKPS